MMNNKDAKTIRFIQFSKRMPILLVFFIVWISPFPAHAFDLYLGTGDNGTFSHFAGRTLSRIISRNAEDINCKTVSAPGDMHNLRDMHNLTNLHQGSLDIALIDSRMLHDAINKKGNFEFLDIKYGNIQVLTPLFDVPITLIVRNDAKSASLEEIKGKRINFGAPRSPQHLSAETIIKIKGWSKKDFSLVTEISESQSQDTMAFCYGSIQAMFHVGIHPDPSLSQLFRLCKTGLADMNDKDVEKLVSDHPAFIKIKIPANTYPSQKKEITTFGTYAVLVASEDLDEKTIYKIMDTIFTNQKRLKNAHPALSSFSLDEIQKRVAGMKLHPGAVKYFSDND